MCTLSTKILSVKSEEMFTSDEIDNQRKTKQMKITTHKKFSQTKF